ncbi:MAG: hypothetical protein K2H22_05925, partial [Muribaculaceae bacterium]|nr:hypothetical protein [Muribaculaceae bacterium]
NRLSNKKTVLKFLAIIAAVIPSLFIVSCHDATAQKGSAESSLGEPRPDEALDKLMRSLAEGDAPGFAALCVYPIVRPYPLKDIEDSLSMVDYFPILVDAPLRERMKKGKTDEWINYGWRGWSIGDDRPIWFDEGVQFIDYQSPAESGLRNILAREELMTLAPQYREGWTPVMTLIQTDGTSIIRIDSNGENYRMMAFDNTDDVAGNPAMFMLGSLRTEGSASTRIFEFADSLGIKAEYSPDSDFPDRIFFSGSRFPKKEMNVRPGYWRDAIRN